MTAMDSFVIIYAQCFYIVLNVLINSNRLGASNDHNCEGYCIIFIKAYHWRKQYEINEYMSVSVFFAGDAVDAVKVPY